MICKPLFYILQFFFRFLSQFCFKKFISIFLISLNMILILKSFLNFLCYFFLFPHFLRFHKLLTNDFREAHHIDFRDIIFEINLAFLKVGGIDLFSLKIKFDSDK